MTASAGEQEYSAAFWSQVEVSQSAASAAGREPPMTQAKNSPSTVAITTAVGVAWSAAEIPHGAFIPAAHDLPLTLIVTVTGPHFILTAGPFTSFELAAKRQVVAPGCASRDLAKF